MFKANAEAKTIKIPVYIENGQILTADPTLKLANKAFGELTILASAVLEDEKRATLVSTKLVEILPTETMLLVVMKPGSGFDNYVPEDIEKVLSPELRRHIYEPLQFGEAVSGPTADGVFLPVVMKESLKMELRGGIKDAKLTFCHCSIPSLNRDSTSLNHAYTLLSQIYEPLRMSHTGSVFTKIYYLIRDKKTWVQLESLRYAEEAYK